MSPVLGWSVVRIGWRVEDLPTRISNADQPEGMSSGNGPTGAPNSIPVSGISGHVCAFIEIAEASTSARNEMDSLGILKVVVASGEDDKTVC